MTLTLRTVASLTVALFSLNASTVLAAQNNGGEPSVPDVCLIGYEVCTAGCNAANPDSGLNFNEYISNQLCMRQCVDALNACIATGGSGSPARKFSIKKLMSRSNAGVDDEPTVNNSPASDAKPPVEPGDRGGDDKGGVGDIFDTGGNFGGLDAFSGN